MDFISFLFRLLVYLILIIGPFAVIYLIFKIRQTSQVIEEVTTKDYTLLRILVPRQNEKTPLAAEEMFASIHGIFRPDQGVQDHLSFELAARDQYIQFFAYVPKELKDYIEGQIYAQYPTVEISEVQDYTNLDLTNWSVAAAELVLTKPDFYPIKTFNNFQVDPLAGITSVLSKVEEGEQIWVQILTRPIADTWQEKTLAYVKMIESGDKPKDDSITIGKVLKGTFGLFSDIAKTATTGSVPAAPEEKKKEKPSLPGPVQEALKAAESKTTKLGFETVIRVCAIARDEATAASKINGLLGAFKQYTVANMNGFALSNISTDKERILPIFQSRAFPTTGYIFNVEELASIFHLPSTAVETPSIVWAGAKKGEPPANLPIEGLAPTNDVTLFGQTNYRHFNHRFGIKTPDRRYHTYAIGKTGTGKSTMLRNMIIDDIQKGRGVCVVDPHGDLISHVLDYIPDDRVDDVIYFNPSDREHPIGFNLLESVDPDLKNIVASGLMSIFTKLWANVWSARMEYILRNTVLALLEYPDATLLEIMKLLVDPVFRRKVMFHVKDPVIRDFFLNEYEKYDPKFRTEAIAPIQNKVGQFLSSSTIRNIMGQVHSTIDVREIMDNKKIFLVDLSVGKIGEDNAALLGSMIITKIQLAAMGRADQPEDDRQDFYLYVDEFQNFATESFAVILSEARKYHLNLIITHQYIAQMPEIVASAVFGNVGTIIAFRVGANDATFLQKEFEPVFDANDLVNLDNYHVYLKMAIDARTATPFSAVTLPPFSGKNDNREKSIKQSIEKYTTNREEIEREINNRNEANSGKTGTLTEVDGEYVYREELKPYEPMNPLPKNTTIDGVEVWKIRDKEGGPYYVSGRDYDSYMWAKEKESDRPGAPKKPDEPKEGGGETPKVEEPVPAVEPAQEPVVKLAEPVVSEQPAAPQSVLKPTVQLQQSRQSQESTNIVRHQNTENNKLRTGNQQTSIPHKQPPQPQRDQSKTGEIIKSEEPKREIVAVANPQITALNPVVASNPIPAIIPAEPVVAMPAKPVATAKPTEPVSQPVFQTVEPLVEAQSKTVEPRVSEPVEPLKPMTQLTPEPKPVQQVPVSSTPVEPLVPQKPDTNNLAAKYNDLDDDDHIIPLQELS